MFLARGLCLVITDRSITIKDALFRKVNLAHFNLFEAQVTNIRGRTRTVDVYTTPSVLIALGLVLDRSGSMQGEKLDVASYGKLGRPGLVDKPMTFGSVAPGVFESAIRNAIQ